MAELSSDLNPHSRSNLPPSTSNINREVQPHAPPTSFRQPTMPTHTPTPTPTTDPNANSNLNPRANPGDNTKSFMRWSTTSSLPSEPETGKSTWSFHPDPDPVPLVELSNPDFGPSPSAGVGTGTEVGVDGAGDRSSFDTFGRGTPPQSRSRKDGEALNEERGLPGRVLKFNKDMRSKKGLINHALKDSTSSTHSSTSDDSGPKVRFSNRNP